MFKYVVGAILILGLLVLLQRGCQSGAERRWERRQERYDWRKENQGERWRHRRGHDFESDEQEEDEGCNGFRKRIFERYRVSDRACLSMELSHGSVWDHSFELAGERGVSRLTAT